MFGVSLNGSDPPKAEQVLLNAAIQVAAECGQSLTCNLFFVVVKRQPAMSVPLLRMRGFSLVIIVMIVAVWSDLAVGTLQICIGHRADSRAKWEFLTHEAFDNASSTRTLCALFPEAVGFAKQENC
jgi:hypothetical protein